VLGAGSETGASFVFRVELTTKMPLALKGRDLYEIAVHDITLGPFGELVERPATLHPRMCVHRI
ncbi:MAG: hypothetical protein AAFP68_07010, partial [Pseudomonadota bacterium]